MSHWTLFSNHGHVLLYIAEDPEARLRDVAASVGITERAVQKIIRDLQDVGILNVTKYGRRNRYQVNTRKALRHPLEAHCTVGQLVQLISETRPPGTPPREEQAAIPGFGEVRPSAPETITRPEPALEPIPEPAAETAPVPLPEPVAEPEAAPVPEPAPAMVEESSLPPGPVVPEASQAETTAKTPVKKTPDKKKPEGNEQGSLF